MVYSGREKRGVDKMQEWLSGPRKETSGQDEELMITEPRVQSEQKSDKGYGVERMCRGGDCVSVWHR